MADRKHLYEFGPFRLDPGERLLARQGTPVALTPKAFDTLLLLVENSGHLLKKEELLSRVWPDVFVEEVNLAQNISLIRKALDGKGIDGEHYIETVPKMGYRFIAPVISNGHKALPPVEVAESKRATWKVVVPALVLVLGLAGLTWYLFRPRPPAEKAPIVLGEFVNRAGDAVFDRTLRQGLSVQLEQSPFLRFLSDDQIHETLRMMGRATDAELSPDIAREVCQRSNAAVTIAGAIDLIGTRYALNLRAVDCANGDLLASTETQAQDKNHVLDALSKLASDMRGKLGEPLSSVRRYNVPLARVTTPSLEALRCYTEAMQLLSKNFDYAASLSWFQKATEVDPKFAMAYWAIGDVYAILGETNSAVEHTRKAFELREGTSEREKALIEANYYYYVLGDVEKARRACEFLSKLYPFSEDAHNSVAVFAEAVGEYDVGLTEYQEALRLAPRSSFLYRDVAYTYLALNRVEDASAVLQKAHTMDSDANLAAVLYGIAFYRDDRGKMESQASSAAGKPEIENLLLALDADTAAYFGQLGKARALSQRASESAERAGKRETSALYYVSSAVREALMGNANRAQKLATIARKYPAGRDVVYGIALASLYADDLKGGQAATEELAKRFPEDTVVRCNYLPALRAKLALAHASPDHAIDVVAAAQPCEFGLPSYSYYNWSNLYPAYVRGEAYLAAHRGAEAAAEFEKILAHRGIVLNEPIGALAHLQLGRARALSGDIARACSAYQDFFTLWKDADPELSVLKQAKAEYAKLSADGCVALPTLGFQ
jgi:DNA-binding winged helix-turn-helix (wHTH) protein/tetratricopeptide (TPR) repeat protein